MDPSQQVRASDQERDQAIDALAEHARTNRLTLEEFDERAAVVAAAQVRDDINALFDDLPEPKPHFGSSAAEPAPVPAVALAAEPAPVPEAPVGKPGNLPAVRRAARATTYGLAMSGGAITIALVVLTGNWLWFFILPPILYALRQASKRW
jgi:hypothetical protein